jgi:rhodanese-related sulfurtransferase
VAQTDKLQFDKNQPIALFCRSGNRAGKAMALLNAARVTPMW